MRAGSKYWRIDLDLYAGRTLVGCFVRPLIMVNDPDAWPDYRAGWRCHDFFQKDRGHGKVFFYDSQIDPKIIAIVITITAVIIEQQDIGRRGRMFEFDSDRPVVCAVIIAFEVILSRLELQSTVIGTVCTLQGQSGGVVRIRGAAGWRALNAASGAERDPHHQDPNP